MDKINKIKNFEIENTTIVSVTYEDSGVFGLITDIPPFYRVVLKQSYGKGSFINTELWLPDNWNGVFVGLGNGGIAGKICYDSLANHIKKGYAAANTDMGTSDGRERGIDNPDVWKDFGWRATHYMSVVSKEIILAHYDKKPDYSYFVGGSTGGQQALSIAQRFATDYDGIVAGVPANNRVFLHTYFLWNHNILTNKDGSVMFTDDEIERITFYATEFFNSNCEDNINDNFIAYPYIDNDTVSHFVEYLAKKMPEFNDNQLDALTKIYNGPKNPRTGEQIYNGMPIGSERFGCGIKDCQGPESPHFYPFVWTFGEGYDGRNFDFDKDLETVSDRLSANLNANNPDLTDFKDNGGKMIMFSGSADPCVPFPDAINYYKRMCDKMGGFDSVSGFCKYFLAPGKDHGTGGFGVKFMSGDENFNSDLLDVIRLWCEKGVEPEYVYGIRKTEENGIEFARKLQAFDENMLAKPLMPVCSEKYLKR